MNTDKQGPNLMVSRHGETYGHHCLQCRHLSREGDYPWYCDQLTTPSGYNFPWNDGNQACGLFEEREQVV